jgi:membrane-associated phospholipid phosphatase
MVGFIYSHDTCTNACPSIHVFNSIGCAVAIMHSQKLKGHNIIRYGSIVLAILISLSTVFIKQHSAFDVMWASVLAIIMYIIVYIPDYSKTRIKNIERKAARKKSAKI